MGLIMSKETRSPWGQYPLIPKKEDSKARDIILKTEKSNNDDAVREVVWQMRFFLVCVNDGIRFRFSFCLSLPIVWKCLDDI